MTRSWPAVLLLACVTSQAEDYAALFDSAAEAIDWNIEDEWAFTETRHQGDVKWVARFDPRRPEGERWEVLSVDGRAPSDAEIRDFREQKEKSNTSDSSDRIEIVGVETLELVEETDRAWRLRFVPDEDEVEFVENVDAIATIVKDGPYVESIDMRNHSDIKPGFGTTIRTFIVHMEFGPAVADGPIVPKRMQVQVSGRTLLFIGFGETELIEYSHFEYAGKDS